VAFHGLPEARRPNLRLPKTFATKKIWKTPKRERGVRHRHVEFDHVERVHVGLAAIPQPPVHVRETLDEHRQREQHWRGESNRPAVQREHDVTTITDGIEMISVVAWKNALVTVPMPVEHVMGPDDEREKASAKIE
jgi:hypothetical protein